MAPFLLVYINFDDISLSIGRAINEREFVTALLNSNEAQALYIGPDMASPLDLPQSKILTHPLTPKSPLSQVRFQAWLFWTLLKIVRKERGNVILCVRPNYFSIAAPLVSMLTKIHYVTKHAGLAIPDLQSRRDAPRIVRSALIRLFDFNVNRSDRIWVVTENIGENWIKRLNVPDKNIFVLPNGANTISFNPFSKESLPDEILRRIPKARFYGCYAGSLRYTGMDYAIRATSRLVAEGEDYVLLIAGEGKDRSYLQGVAREEGIEDRIVFLGMLPYRLMPALYRFCDVLFAAYPHEYMKQYGSSSQKLFQYLASGKPVIATRDAGHNALNHKNFGMFVDPVNIEELKASIKELCESDSYQNRNIALARYNYIEKEHSYGKLVFSLLRHLNQLN